jgi:guanylate kinase
MWSDPVSRVGKLIIISGPSGAGKSTVVRRLMQACPLPIELSVSVTTRAARQGEADGRDYHFVSKERFQELRTQDAFLECKEVFGRGDWYGTLRKTVDNGLSEGKWVLLEIDVQGAICVMEQCPNALSFFVHPGSLDELEVRLRRRATDSEEAILRRLQVAADELQAVSHYRYEIINREVEHSVQEICRLLQNHNEEGSNARST